MWPNQGHTKATHRWHVIAGSTRVARSESTLHLDSTSQNHGTIREKDQKGEGKGGKERDKTVSSAHLPLRRQTRAGRRPGRWPLPAERMPLKGTHCGTGCALQRGAATRGAHLPAHLPGPGVEGPSLLRLPLRGPPVPGPPPPRRGPAGAHGRGPSPHGGERVAIALRARLGGAARRLRAGTGARQREAERPPRIPEAAEVAVGAPRGRAGPRRESAVGRAGRVMNSSGEPRRKRLSELCHI